MRLLLVVVVLVVVVIRVKSTGGILEEEEEARWVCYTCSCNQQRRKSWQLFVIASPCRESGEVVVELHD